MKTYFAQALATHTVLGSDYHRVHQELYSGHVDGINKAGWFFAPGWRLISEWSKEMKSENARAKAADNGQG